MEDTQYTYHFHCPDGTEKDFTVDTRISDLKQIQCEAMPDWALLEYKQCPNCPLTIEDSIYCPLAIDVEPVINGFSDFASYDLIDVTIEGKDREVHAKKSMQKVLSALLGLIMASSACPHMQFLRPLARFHSPFASKDETIFRVVSMCLMKQYIEHGENEEVTLSLDELKKKYEELQVLNSAFAKRLKDVIKRDAAVNAVVLLDILSKNVSISLESSLKQIRKLFNAE